MDRATRLVGRGDQMMQEGDVAGARLFYERAVDIGFAKAAIALAETYDPGELGRWPVRGLQPNVELARQWYERALQLGAPEAGERLRRLSSR
jgi:TPR repeat protein